MDHRSAQVLRHSVQSAHQCLEEGQFGRAFAHFLLIFRLDASAQLRFRREFLACFKEWSTELLQTGRFDDFFHCVESIQLFEPRDDELLTYIGGLFFKLHLGDRGLTFFTEALKVNTDNLLALQNFESTKRLAVERYHFRTLNDRRRNDAYRIVLSAYCRDRTVLDIGAGMGLLAVQAAQLGARKVYACEKSPATRSILDSVVQENGMTAIVETISKNSLQIDIPQDVEGRVDVIVVETFDAALLGEGIMASLVHAVEKLLAPGGHVVPHSATVYCCLMESFPLVSSYWLKSDLLSNLIGLNMPQMSVECNDLDQYLTENLSTLKWRPLSQPTALMTISFTDVAALTQCLNGFSRTISVMADTAGELHAAVVWFELHLAGDVNLSSGPMPSVSASAATSWRQAIFPLRPRDLQPQSNVQLEMKVSADHLRLTEAGILDPVLEAPASILSVSNDIGYHAFYLEGLRDILSRGPIESVLVLSHCSLLLPLFLQSKVKVVLVHVVNDDDDDGDALSDVLHELVDDNVKFIVDLNVDEMNQYGVASVDLIVAELIDTNGQLRKGVLDHLHSAKSNMLKPGGHVFPSALSIQAAGAECQGLYADNYCDDSAIGLDIKISHIVHSYSSLLESDIRLGCCQHKELTEQTTLMTLSLEEPTTALPKLMSMRREMRIQREGELTNFFIWFSLHAANSEKTYCTRQSDSINTCARLLHEKVKVETGLVMVVNCLFHASFVDVRFCSLEGQPTDDRFE